MADDTNDWANPYQGGSDPSQGAGGSGSGYQSFQDYQTHAQGYEAQNYHGWGQGLQLALGGPLGWYEAIKNSTGGGEDSWQVGLRNALGDHPASRFMNELTYNSMTPNDWAQFNTMSDQQQADFVHKRTMQVAMAQSFKGAQQKTQQAAQDKQAQYDQWRTQVLQQLQDYATKMNMSVADLVKNGDAGVVAAGGQGVRAAGNQNLLAGISGGGGLSVANTQKAMYDSQLGYQMQRQQLGLQATNALQSGLQQQYMNYTDQQRYNQQMQLQLQQARAASQMFQYQQQQAQAGGTMGMIGAGLGAYFGGPQGAAAGYNVGYGMGAQTAGPAPSYNYQYPTGQSPWGVQNSGGFGSRGYGGAQ